MPNVMKVMMLFHSLEEVPLWARFWPWSHICKRQNGRGKNSRLHGWFCCSDVLLSAGSLHVTSEILWEGRNIRISENSVTCSRSTKPALLTLCPLFITSISYSRCLYAFPDVYFSSMDSSGAALHHQLSNVLPFLGIHWQATDIVRKHW